MDNISLPSNDDDNPPWNTLSLPWNIAKKWLGSFPSTTLTWTGRPPRRSSNSTAFNAAVPLSSWLDFCPYVKRKYTHDRFQRSTHFVDVGFSHFFGKIYKISEKGWVILLQIFPKIQLLTWTKYQNKYYSRQQNSNDLSKKEKNSKNIAK